MASAIPLVAQNERGERCLVEQGIGFPKIVEPAEEETKDETSEENEGSIHLVGSQKGETDIHDIVLKANESVGFRFELDEEDVWNRSDQINFFQKGVPVSFLFGGFHPDYHRPSDKVGDINFKKLVSAAKLYYLAVNLASEHGPFEMKPQSRK